MPNYAVREVGNLAIPFPIVGNRATPALVIDWTLLWMNHAPHDVREELARIDAADQASDRAFRDDSARASATDESGEIRRTSDVGDAPAAHSDTHR